MQSNQKVDHGKEETEDAELQNHWRTVLATYEEFEKKLIENMKKELKEIKDTLKIELLRTIKKLEFKLKSTYKMTISEIPEMLYLQKYAQKEEKSVYQAIDALKKKVHSYIEEFSHAVSAHNIKRENSLSLFHDSNSINSSDNTWKSVTSTCLLGRAEISVRGFNRPKTSWLALGVSKKMKEFGQVSTSLAKEDFMGNIYLNGSESYDENYKLGHNLREADTFVIDCENRILHVSREHEAKKRNEMFILDDNVDYYLYIAIRGPIQLSFKGFETPR